MLTSDRKISTSGCFCNPHNLTGYKLPAKTYAKNNKVLVSQKSKKAIVKWQIIREM